jgi:hypothetical protein
MGYASTVGSGCHAKLAVDFGEFCRFLAILADILHCAVVREQPRRGGATSQILDGVGGAISREPLKSAERQFFTCRLDS